MGTSQEKIRILFTIPNFDTAGSQQVLFHIASNLDSSKFSPHICCLTNTGAYYKTVQKSGIPLHIFPFAVPLRPRWSLIFRVIRLAGRFRKLRPHIIHSFHWSSDITEPLAARLAGCKWVYTKKNMSWGNRHWKIRSMLAHGIITINPQMHSLFFPGKKQVKMIPCSVNTGLFSPGEKDKALQDSLHIPQNHKIIVSVAFISFLKGIDTLISAISKLKSENVTLVLVGNDEGREAGQLKKLAYDLGVQDLVRFVGMQSDVVRYLKLADVFVLATVNQGRKEALGVAIMEAMACGIPVLGSDTQGVRFILEGFPQYIFKEGNSEMLAEKIRRLIRLPFAQKQRLSKALRDVIISRFSPEKEISTHEDFYQSLV